MRPMPMPAHAPLPAARSPPFRRSELGRNPPHQPTARLPTHIVTSSGTLSTPPCCHYPPLTHTVCLAHPGEGRTGAQAPPAPRRTQIARSARPLTFPQTLTRDLFRRPCCVTGLWGSAPLNRLSCQSPCSPPPPPREHGSPCALLRFNLRASNWCPPPLPACQAGSEAYATASHRGLASKEQTPDHGYPDSDEYEARHP